MVMYALAAVLLPLVMAGNPQMMFQQQQGWNKQQGWGQDQQQQGWGQQQQGWGQQQQGWGQDQQQQGWGQQQQGWGVQMQGTVQMGGQQQQQHQQQQQASNNWWGMENQEDYEAYLRWCEERRMAIAEQEQQEKFLKDLKERSEMRKREMAREAAMKENKAKRETMVAQWRMWQSQLAQSEEFDGHMEKYTQMKMKYMFSLTMDFLKFCKCADYTSHLQRYLIMDGQSYMPATDMSVPELEGIDTRDVDAVAQRLAQLSEVEVIKAFFGGTIESMCSSVKAYVDQVKTWETQYNFMGI